MNTTMNAIGYARVSTAEQADSGLGMAAQEERIQAYCRMKALELREIVSDNGVSGGKSLHSRPGGAALLDALKRKLGLAVVVLKLDRAFRNAADCLATVEKWDRTGIALHIVDLGGNSIDSTTAAGKFMLTVLAGAAEMERNLTSERTKAAMQVKRARGQRISRHIPYGYDLGPDETTLIENLGEQAVIEEILQARARGVALAKIAQALTDRGIPTKQGGTRWSHKTVVGIVQRHESNGASGTYASEQGGLVCAEESPAA